MRIITHRGYWKTRAEQNTLTAFQRAIDAGFGIETDIRDFNCDLVISHDLPSKASLPAQKAFKLFSNMSSHQILAINIKSDGLQDLVLKYLRRHGIKNYFVFDASVPDARGYLKKKISFMTRQSELEQNPAFLESARGIWLDSVDRDWYNARIVQKHLTRGKDVCIVSPELHGRPHLNVWKLLKTTAFKISSEQLSLCTDLPSQALTFFGREKTDAKLV